MSKKAVEQYYNQICEQYKEMLENIHDLEKEIESGMVEPERIEALQKMIQPLKTNYERWAYMMFLLNEPTRKSKRDAYRRRNKKLLASIDSSASPDAILSENATVLKEMQS